MKNVLIVLAIYTIWALFDYINMFLLFDRFLLVDRKPAKKTRFLWIILMFLISYVYGLQYSDILFHKVLALCIFIPYYFKVLPVLWTRFCKRIKHILIILFYQLLVATVSQGMYIFVYKERTGSFRELILYDLCELFCVMLITLFLLLLLFFRKNNILKIYFGELSTFQYIAYCIALFIANLIEAEFIVVYTGEILFKMLSVLNIGMICVLISQIIFVRESNTRRAMVIGILDEQMGKITECYNQIIKKETQTKKFRHDIKNHLIVLASLVQQGQNEKALEYIEKLDEIRKISTPQYDTGNFIADTLLSAKSESAEESNTELLFQGFIPNDFENVLLFSLEVIFY